MFAFYAGNVCLVTYVKCPLIFRAHLHNVFSYKSVSAVKPPHSARALIFPLLLIFLVESPGWALIRNTGQRNSTLPGVFEK